MAISSFTSWLLNDLTNFPSMTAEPKKLIARTLDELDELLNTHLLEEGSTYSLDVTVHLSQEALVKLSESPLGMILERLDLHPEYDEDNHTIDFYKTKFPMLKELSILHQFIQSVYFTAECFPLLESLHIEQPLVPDQFFFNTDLPNLVHMSLRFVGLILASEFGPSLSRSPKLKTFISYKLYGLGCKADHKIVLPNITNLDFYRCEDLKGLKLWAPRLENLNLQACYSIRKVDILNVNRKPAGFPGPEYDFKGEPSKFEVNCTNCCDMPKGSMATSPRCKNILRPVEDPMGGL